MGPAMARMMHLGRAGGSRDDPAARADHGGCGRRWASSVRRVPTVRDAARTGLAMQTMPKYREL